MGVECPMNQQVLQMVINEVSAVQEINEMNERVTGRGYLTVKSGKTSLMK